MKALLLMDLVLTDFPTINESDDSAQILEKMQAASSDVLPLIKNNELIALIREEDIAKGESDKQQKHIVSVPAFRPFVYDHFHPYQAASRLSELDISLIPVLNEENEYSGVVKGSDLLHYFCDNTGISQTGAIITLRIKNIDYSLSEIARICESNDVIILNIQLKIPPQNEYMNVIIKTNTKNLQGLISSFERYEYTVQSVYGGEHRDNDLEDRYKSLMNYINM